MFVGEATLPEGLRIYAIGDVHGCHELLIELLANIRIDLEANPVNQHQIITLGDYCDRGPETHNVIELLIKESANKNFICLCGNHDRQMMNFMNTPHEIGEAFLTYGGRQTLASYGVKDIHKKSLVELADDFSRQVPDSHKQFLNELPLTHTEGDYMFVHAGIKPNVSLNQQSSDDMLWIRNEFLIFQDSFGKVIVHGHTIHDWVDIRTNRINVDTAAFESGILSCIVLESNQQRIITSGISH